MSVPAAYFGILLIWSTTPLAIQWSTQGVDFTFAVLTRMLIGLTVSLALLIFGRMKFPFHPRARLAYAVSGAALFGSMALSYWAARYIHSGLISVMFGLAPLMASIMSTIMLGEKSLTTGKAAGLFLGITGLTFIFLEGDQLGGEHFLGGLIAMFFSVFFYSAGLVWLKRINDDSPPLATTVGALAVASVLFALLWLAIDGTIPDSLPLVSGVSIVYLGVFGSALAFTLYYYVIKHLRATRITLINITAPVAALMLGKWLNAEDITPNLWIGTTMILLGLAANQPELLQPILRRFGKTDD